MTKPTADRLSAHLLREARRFEVYPNRVYRTPKNMQFQRFFDNIGHELITQRETFMATAATVEGADPDKISVWFDELYCRSLLALIPDVVSRTVRLRTISLKTVPRGHLLTYLKEASRTYAMGFFAASVALSRAAVEACLRPRVGKYLGASEAAELDLFSLIDRAAIRDKHTKDLAHKVRTVANDVLHEGRAVSGDEAFEVIEAARTVVAYMER